jgi:hypothetical protein
MLNGELQETFGGSAVRLFGGTESQERSAVREEQTTANNEYRRLNGELQETFGGSAVRRFGGSAVRKAKSVRLFERSRQLRITNIEG